MELILIYLSAYILCIMCVGFIYNSCTYIFFTYTKKGKVIFKEKLDSGYKIDYNFYLNDFYVPAMIVLYILMIKG